MQGEADAGHPGGQYDGYNCTLPAMIRDWRAQWHVGTGGATDPDIPFGIAQLNSVANGSGTFHCSIYSNIIQRESIELIQVRGVSRWRTQCTTGRSTLLAVIRLIPSSAMLACGGPRLRRT
jgi:hypothetical protein